MPHAPYVFHLKLRQSALEPQLFPAATASAGHVFGFAIVCVGMSSRQNEFPVTHIVAGTSTEGVLRILPGVCMAVCGQIRQCNGHLTVHVAVTSLHRCVLEIRLKAEFKVRSRQEAICLPLYEPGPLLFCIAEHCDPILSRARCNNDTYRCVVRAGLRIGLVLSMTSDVIMW